MPHVTSIEELLALANQRRAAGDLDKALGCLNEAIGRQTPPSLDALLSRSRIHHVQSRNAEALDDARAAIKHHAKDIRGYLQAGSILRKMSKSLAAIKIYQYGIDKGCNAPDRLRRARNALRRDLIACDPFEHFPVELVELVLGHLSFQQIVCCTRVSKTWHRTITGIPRLWYRIDLSDAPAYLKADNSSSKRYGSVTNLFISACIKRSKNKIHAVHLQSLKSMDKVIYALTKSCKELTAIKLQQVGIYSEAFVNSISAAKNLKKLELGSAGEVSLENIISIVNACPVLEHFDAVTGGARHATSLQSDTIQSRPRLRHLRIRCNRRGSCTLSGHRAFYTKFPNIEELLLDGVMVVFGERELDLLFFEGRRLGSIAHLRSMRRFEMTNVPRSRSPIFTLPDDGQELKLHTAVVFRHNLRNIISLELQSMDQLLTDPAIPVADNAMPSLKILILRSLMRDQFYDDGIASQSDLLEFHVEFQAELADADLNYISENLKSLRALTLSHAQITGLGVLALLKLPELKRLTIRGTYIESDVIQRVRDKGIVFHYSATIEWRSGRRIREG